MTQNGHVIRLPKQKGHMRLRDTPDGRKIKGTIHWVSEKHAGDVEVRLYDRLFTAENPAAVAKFVEWATSQAGASTLSAYFVTASK